MSSGSLNASRAYGFDTIIADEALIARRVLQVRFATRDLPRASDSRTIAFLSQCRAFCSAFFAAADCPVSR